MSLLNFFIFCAVIVMQSSAFLSGPTSCKNSSTECLKEAFQSCLPVFIKGDPAVGTGSLDPFIINNLTLTLPGDLKIELTQGTSRGLRKCIIDSARMVRDTLDLQFHCNLTIKGKYKSMGRLLMFVINGDGDSMIKCKNIKIQFLAKLGPREYEDGKKHLEIKAFKSHHSYEGQVFYRMTNLIKENPQLGNLVVEFMNRNWRLVAEEFGKPIVDYGISNILSNAKKVLKATPHEDLIRTLKNLNVEMPK